MKEVLNQFGEVLEEVSLTSFNTFRVSGVCKYMVFPNSFSQVEQLIQYLKAENIHYFILGNGSNIILTEEYFDGVFVSLKKISILDIQGCFVRVSAGVMMPHLALETINQNLTGLEWAASIPGTVGGCIYGNAEAYLISTFDYLKEVTVLNPGGVIEVLLKEDLSYGYRTSFFKEHAGYIILEAKFELLKGDKEESLELVRKRQKKRIATQPLEYPSAGSVFRNPSPENPSGKIIEELGLKGYRIGGAEVSQKHANFIINLGNATGKDIQNLVELIHQKVLEERGIDLFMEQEYIGWNEYEESKDKEKIKIT